MRTATCLLLCACQWLSFAAAGTPPADTIAIQILDASGKSVARAASRGPGGTARMAELRPYQPGDVVRIDGPKLMFVRLDRSMPEVLVYCPKGRFEFPVPFGREARAFGPLEPKRRDITARPAQARDLLADRNLALNPYDTLQNVAAFPHAKTNNVCRRDPVFAARNAIDGATKNKGHGQWPFQSWGPDQKNGLWWKVEMGRPVEVARVAVVLRADVPHDKFFGGANIVFSDGTKQWVDFKPSGEKQVFTFPRKVTASVTLRDLRLPNPPGWCAIMEVEVWGREAVKYSKSGSWRETLATQLGGNPRAIVERMLRDFPGDRQAIEVAADWVAQDGVGRDKGAIARVVESLGDSGRALRAELAALDLKDAPANDARRLTLYLEACERRRQARFAPYRETMNRIVFTKHYDLGGSHYAYTEGQSDAQAERHFRPGTALCVLDLSAGLTGKVATLVDDKGGVIRDPDVSFDATRVLYAHKKDLNKDDYHLYEYHLATGKTRQITRGLGMADYEGCYLPNGHIVFNSSRCVQTVDCWWTEVSNLYTCDGDGRYLRRLSFDQVHTNSPTVTADGRVIYTRWDYSDRGQIYPQALFQMNPDGTNQQSLYGNNSWFPTTILHARGIAGSQKIVCVFSGHHSRQKGWLGMLDPRRGREEADGAQLIAPVRETKPVHVDSYGQSGDQFQYPYPLDERHYLVTFKPVGARHFAIYFMDVDGRRELLVSDPSLSCNQPIPLASRPVPHARPSLVDYGKATAAVFLQDIYEGPGLAGIERGAIKRLRVVSPQFRAAGIGSNGNSGPAGGAMASTPVSIQGTWDPKVILGTATVQADGSAFFEVPARTPLYFQALDAKGHAVQSMRSWVTLQPGEKLSCVGCHEAKGNAPPATATPRALFQPPEKLEPFFDGPPRGFSFIGDVQPILDKHCIRCHNQRGKTPSGKSAGKTPGDGKAFDPKTHRYVVPIATDGWRYTTTNPGGRWIKPHFDDSKWQTAPGGFGDGVPGGLPKTAWKTTDIWLRRTVRITEPLHAPQLIIHHDDDAEAYLDGKLAARYVGFTVRYEVRPMPEQVACAIAPGEHVLAVHCSYKGGGRYIDAGLVDLKTAPPKPLVVQKDSTVRPAFSLLGTQTLESRSCRKWSDAYKALANRRACNWINVQSAPPMLPPYHAGAAKSRLITRLEEGHNGVKLSARELHLIATWIDLLVPYCGDYTEAMAENLVPKYQKFAAKRKRLAEEDARNIQALLGQTAEPAAQP